MWFFSDKCSSCGARVDQGAAFCGQCGEPSPRAKMVCPTCEHLLKATAKFCSQCRTPITPSAARHTPDHQLNRWGRSADEFARRIDVTDLRPLLYQGLVVEPGTQAVIFQGENIVASVNEGTYSQNEPIPGIDVGSITSAAAVLVNVGNTTLPLLYRGFRTREGLAVDTVVEVVVRLADPIAFNANLLNTRQKLTTAALAELVWSTGANVVEARVKQSQAEELAGNLELKDTLEADLREDVAPVLKRNGLDLVQLHFVRFSMPDYDKIHQKRAKTFIGEQKADELDRRAALNRRIRETLTRDRMDKFNSANELEQYIRQTEHEMGMKEVIRREEMESLKRDFDEKKQDRELARQHLLQRLELEQELELLRIRRNLDDGKAKHAREQQRQRQEADWEAAQHQVRIENLQNNAARGEERARLELAREKAELGMTLRKQKIALEHEEETQKDLRELHRKSEEIRLQESMKDADARRRQEEQEQHARLERERIQALSDAEQTRLAMDLQKTESMKDMSEDQILAMMAKESPHVAAAIAERAKAQGNTNDEIRELYAKLLAGKESEADRIERFARESMAAVEHAGAGSAGREREQKQEMKGMMSESMDHMAGVAGARAGAGAEDSENSAAVNIVCPNCHAQAPTGSKFCENCGHQFFN